MAITETKTKYGQIHGVQKDGYTVFRGVPYAKPPVGEKRFCPPLPLTFLFAIHLTTYRGGRILAIIC